MGNNILDAVSISRFMQANAGMSDINGPLASALHIETLNFFKFLSDAAFDAMVRKGNTLYNPNLNEEKKKRDEEIIARKRLEIAALENDLERESINFLSSNQSLITELCKDNYTISTSAQVNEVLDFIHSFEALDMQATQIHGLKGALPTDGASADVISSDSYIEAAKACAAGQCNIHKIAKDTKAPEEVKAALEKRQPEVDKAVKYWEEFKTLYRKEFKINADPKASDIQKMDDEVFIKIHEKAKVAAGVTGKNLSEIRDLLKKPEDLEIFDAVQAKFYIASASSSAVKEQAAEAARIRGDGGTKATELPITQNAAIDVNTVA